MAMRMWIGVWGVAFGLGGCLDQMGTGRPDDRGGDGTGGGDDTSGTSGTSGTDDTSGTSGPGDTVGGDTSPTDPNEPDPNEPDPNEPDPNEPDPDDPNGPLESRAWCLPYAKGATETYVRFDVPAEVFDQVCPLALETETQSWSDADTVTRYTWDGDVLWVARGADFLQSMTFDAAGHLVRTRIGTQRNHALAFAPWDDVHRVDWNGAGGVVEFATERGGSAHVYLRQTWRDGRLVARSEERNRYDQATGALELVPLETTWHYEGERLVGATSTDGAHTWTVAWSYDEDGRPAAVERARDGVVSHRMTWAYDADNRLARRTIVRHGYDAWQDGYSAEALDTFGQPAVDNFNGDLWVNAVPRLDPVRGCVVPPTSDDYGYPRGEVAYELGMPDGERPHGIGFAYGADTYGWNYGDGSWYSHAGVAGLEPQDRGWLDVDSDIRYVRGVMVEEHVASEGPITETHRVRSFEGGRLSVDRADIVLVRDPGDGQPITRTSYGRELRFTWDLKGPPDDKLIERRLVDDAAGLLEWQSWSRDAATGRWLGHSIYGASEWGTRAAIRPYYDVAACTERCEPELRMVYARTVDGAGRTLERWSSRPDADAILREESHERWAYDDAGRVTVSEANGGYTQRWAYDAEGRQTRYSWDYDGIGEVDGWTDSFYDEAGRWVGEETWSQGELSSRRAREFACE